MVGVKPQLELLQSLVYIDSIYRSGTYITQLCTPRNSSPLLFFLFVSFLSQLLTTVHYQPSTTNRLQVCLFRPSALVQYNLVSSEAVEMNIPSTQRQVVVLIRGVSCDIERF